MKGIPGSPEMKAKAIQLYRESLGCRAIARELGLNHSTVWNWVTDSNIGKLRVRRPTPSASIKDAVPRVTADSKITIVSSVLPGYAPYCNATVSGIYQGRELSYRR